MVTTLETWSHKEIHSDLIVTGDTCFSHQNLLPTDRGVW
jgi:hypothetical protein